MRIELLTKKKLTYAEIKDDADKVFANLTNLSSDKGAICYEKGTKIKLFVTMDYQSSYFDGKKDYDYLHNRLPEKEYYCTPIKCFRTTELIKFLEIIDKHYPDSYVYDEWILNSEYYIFSVRDYINWISQKGFDVNIYKKEPYCIRDYDISHIIYDGDFNIRDEILPLLKAISKKVIVSNDKTITCYSNSDNYSSIVVNNENNYTDEQKARIDEIKKALNAEDKKSVIISTRNNEEFDVIEKWLKKTLKQYTITFFDELGHYYIYSSNDDELITTNDDRYKEEEQQ